MVILGFGLRALVAPGGGRGYGQQATATLITANLTSHGQLCAQLSGEYGAWAAPLT
jgi:hypothetical protein